MTDGEARYRALLEAARKYVGVESALETACDAVESGAVRRYAQAIGDEDPAYAAGASAAGRYGGAVAPPLFPTWMFRRPLGEPDPIDAHAHDPDFDGVGAPAAQGLPPIEPLAGLPVLNGGADVELLRYARHGETVTVRSRYAEVDGRKSSNGWMILVVIESEYRTASGELLLRVRRTGLRRLIDRAGS